MGDKMRIKQHLAILLFGLGVVSTGLTAATTLNKQQLITISGMQRQVQEVPAAMRMGIEQALQQGVPVDNKIAKALVETVSTAYNSHKILSFIDKGLQKLLSAEDERVLMAHYNSSLGKRITELEVKGSRPEAMAEMQAYAQKLMANPSEHTERLALYQEVDKAVGGTKMAVDLAMSIQVAVQVGMISASNGPKNLDIAALRTAAEKTRFALTQQTASAVLMQFAYIYRDLSKKELTAYVAFLNSPAGKKFNMGGMKLLNEALALQSEEFGKQLMLNLERKPV
jgi:hypothetical protein